MFDWILNTSLIRINALSLRKYVWQQERDCIKPITRYACRTMIPAFYVINSMFPVIKTVLTSNLLILFPTSHYIHHRSYHQTSSPPEKINIMRKKPSVGLVKIDRQSQQSILRAMWTNEMRV